MSHFEAFVESNFPFASDFAKRNARDLFEQMKTADALSTDFPPLCDRYNEALEGLSYSHATKCNELFEVTFANDRRINYVSDANN